MTGHVLVFGSINQDYILEVSHRPQAGETVSGATFRLGPGGKGANQAVAAARMGARVELVGRVGNDHQGTELVALLAGENIGVSHIRQTDSHTGVAIVEVTPDAENSIIVAPGAGGQMEEIEADILAAGSVDAAVIVSQLEVPIAAVAAAISAAGPQTLVLLNAAPAVTAPPGLLGKVDILVVNEIEAATLLGEPGLADPLAMAQQLCEAGPKVAVVTLGPGGAAAAVAGQAWIQGAPKVEAVDTTGAGDMFVGALAAFLAVDSDAQDLSPALVAAAVEKAVVAASHSVTRKGAWPSFGARGG